MSLSSCSIRAVPLDRPKIDQFAQITDLGLSVRDRELREENLAKFEIDVGSLRNQQGVVDGSRKVALREEVAHLIAGLQVVLAALELEPLLLAS